MSSEPDLLILYASETGTAEDLAFKIWSEAKHAKKIRCSVMNIVDFPPERLMFGSVNVMFIIATSGDGDIVADMKAFWKFFLRKKMGPSSLSGLRMSVFGLGDSSYEKYNASARKFFVRMLQLGATAVVPLGLGDDQAGYGYNSALYPWLTGFWTACQDAGMMPVLLPGASDNDRDKAIDGVGDGGMTVHGHYIVRLLETAPATITSTTSTTSTTTTHKLDVEAEAKNKTCRLEELLRAAHSNVDIVTGTVKSAVRATAPQWEQDVRLLQLLLPESADTDSPPITFLGGDIAKIYPANSDAFIARFLARFAPTLSTLTGLNAGTDGLSLSVAGEVMLYIEASAQCPVRKTRLLGLTNHSTVGFTFSSSTATEVSSPARHRNLQCSLLELLRYVLDIQGVPKPSFFEMCACYATDPVEREKLLEMASANGTDLYYDYCIQERRNFVEVLEEFPSVALDLPCICAIIPLLKPREFSVASSSVATKNNMHLCIGLVKFKTKYKRQRTGTCSRFVESVQVGDKICVSVSKGAFSEVYSKANVLARPHPQEVHISPWSSPVMAASAIISGRHMLQLQQPVIPVILVGPGTGIAPMRAIVQERLAIRDAVSAAQTQTIANARNVAVSEGIHTLVFYGCRKFQDDCLYRSEWCEYSSDIQQAYQTMTTSNAQLPPAPPDASAPTQHHDNGVFVSVAFSQEQVMGQLDPVGVGTDVKPCPIPETGKVYVTHKIRQHSALTWTLLQQGAVIFIAGAAGKRMPSNVRNAFLEVIQHHQGCSPEQATQYFRERFETKGKFLVEAWS